MTSLTIRFSTRKTIFFLITFITSCDEISIMLFIFIQEFKTSMHVTSKLSIKSFSKAQFYFNIKINISSQMIICFKKNKSLYQFLLSELFFQYMQTKLSYRSPTYKMQLSLHDRDYYMLHCVIVILTLIHNSFKSTPQQG